MKHSTRILGICLLLTLLVIQSESVAFGVVEDLSVNWTEVDPDSIYVVNSTHIQFVDLEPVHDNDWVYRDMGADNIGDYNTSFEFQFTQIASSTSPASKFVLLGSSDTLDDLQNFVNATYLILRSTGTADQFEFRLFSELAGSPTASSSTAVLSTNTVYYADMSKLGAITDFYVYDDAGRSNQVAYISVTGSANFTTQYWLSTVNDFASGGGQDHDGYLGNIRLNSSIPDTPAGAPLPKITLSSPTHASSIFITVNTTFQVTPQWNSSYTASKIEIWTNYTGTWENLTEVTTFSNATLKDIFYTFNEGKAILWNAKLYTNSTDFFAVANRTLTILVYEDLSTGWTEANDGSNAISTNGTHVLFDGDFRTPADLRFVKDATGDYGSFSYYFDLTVDDWSTEATQQRIYFMGWSNVELNQEVVEVSNDTWFGFGMTYDGSDQEHYGLIFVDTYGGNTNQTLGSKNELTRGKTYYIKTTRTDTTWSTWVYEDYTLTTAVAPYNPFVVTLQSDYANIDEMMLTSSLENSAVVTVTGSLGNLKGYAPITVWIQNLVETDMSFWRRIAYNGNVTANNKLEVSDSSGFGTILDSYWDNSTAIIETYALSTNLLPNSTHYYRLKQYNVTDDSLLYTSPTYNFTTNLDYTFMDGFYYEDTPFYNSLGTEDTLFNRHVFYDPVTGRVYGSNDDVSVEGTSPNDLAFMYWDDYPVFTQTGITYNNSFENSDNKRAGVTWGYDGSTYVVVHSSIDQDGTGTGSHLYYGNSLDNLTYFGTALKRGDVAGFSVNLRIQRIWYNSTDSRWYAYFGGGDVSNGGWESTGVVSSIDFDFSNDDATLMYDKNDWAGGASFDVFVYPPRSMMWFNMGAEDQTGFGWTSGCAILQMPYDFSSDMFWSNTTIVSVEDFYSDNVTDSEGLLSTWVTTGGLFDLGRTNPSGANMWMDNEGRIWHMFYEYAGQDYNGDDPNDRWIGQMQGYWLNEKIGVMKGSFPQNQYYDMPNEYEFRNILDARVYSQDDGINVTITEYDAVAPTYAVLDVEHDASTTLVFDLDGLHNVTAYLHSEIIGGGTRYTINNVSAGAVQTLTPTDDQYSFNVLAQIVAPSITLNSPADEASVNVNENTTFQATPYWYGSTTASKIEIWTNYTGTWTNLTEVLSFSNATLKDLIYNFAEAKTILWNAKLYTNQSDVFASANRTLTIISPVESMTLTSPDGTSIKQNPVVFTYTPDYNVAVYNASLWMNVSGTWQQVAVNSSAIVDASANTLEYNVTQAKQYIWNVKMHTSSGVVWGVANKTFTMVYAYPTSYSIEIGSLDSGSLTSTYVYSAGSDVLQINEVTGVTGCDVRFNFTGVNEPVTDAEWRMYGKYTGNPVHVVWIQVYNFTSGGWVNRLQLVSDAGYAWHNTTLVEDGVQGQDLVSGGVIMARVLHSSAGNPAHDTFFDFVALEAQSRTNSIDLHAPADGSSHVINTLANFTAHPIAYDVSITSVELWTNLTGSWAKTAENLTVTNNTNLVISYSPTSLGNIIWNMKLITSGSDVFHHENWTLTISSAPPAGVINVVDALFSNLNDGVFIFGGLDKVYYLELYVNNSLGTSDLNYTMFALSMQDGDFWINGTYFDGNGSVTMTAGETYAVYVESNYADSGTIRHIQIGLRVLPAIPPVPHLGAWVNGFGTVGGNSSWTNFPNLCDVLVYTEDEGDGGGGFGTGGAPAPPPTVISPERVYPEGVAVNNYLIEFTAPNGRLFTWIPLPAFINQGTKGALRFLGTMGLMFFLIGAIAKRTVDKKRAEKRRSNVVYVN